MYGEEHICPVCGNPFVGFRNVVYCSKKCRKKAYRKRLKERGLCSFESRICEICGKPFVPRTPNQHTCGGDCTAEYIRRTYNVGRREQEEPLNYEWCYDEYRTSLLEWLEMSKTNIQEKIIVECRKRFLDELEPSLGQSSNRMQLAQMALTTAKELDVNFPFWRELPVHKQEALLNLSVGIGIKKLLQREDICEAIRNQRWNDVKSLILCLAWSKANGQRAVKMCRQLVSAF